MSVLLKLLDEFKKPKPSGNLAEKVAMSLLKEYSSPLTPAQLNQILIVLPLLPVPHKVSAVYAVVNLLKQQFEEISDENYFIDLSYVLLQVISLILNFFVEKSGSTIFNSQDEYFSKSVKTALTVFIPLRKKSNDLGFAFMKTCSPQILTLLTCKRLSFSIRREGTLLYAEEVSKCDRTILKRLNQAHSSLLSDLVQWIPSCGDFQLQEALLEIAVYNSATTPEKLCLIKKWLSTSEYDPAVDSLSFNNLSSSTRLCLNYINSLTKPKNVYTLACQKCFGDNHIPIIKPKDEDYKELWVDFNTSTKSINLIYTPDTAQPGWHRLVLNFDNIKSLDCSPLYSLIKKTGDEFKLLVTFKERIPVITLGQPHEFSCLNLIFLNSLPLKELINEFLSNYFTNLVNPASMNDFKTPEQVKPGRKSGTPKSCVVGAKDYFSRRTSPLTPRSPNIFLAKSNECLKKYLKLTANKKPKSVKYNQTHDCLSSFQEETTIENSTANTSLSESINKSIPSSSSFVTEHSKIKRADTGRNSTKTLLNASWKSSESPFTGFHDSSLQRHLETGEKKINCYNLLGQVTGREKKKVTNDLLLELPRSYCLNNVDIDTTIALDSNTDEDEYISELRSAPTRESPPINFENVSIPWLSENDKTCGRKLHSKCSSVLLEEDSGDSNLSELGPRRPSFSDIQNYTEQIEEIPVTVNYSSDSVIENSPPKFIKNKDLSKRRGKCYRSGSESILSNKTSPALSSSTRQSDEIFFISNKNKVATEFCDPYMSLKDIGHVSAIEKQVEDCRKESVQSIKSNVSSFQRPNSFASKIVSEPSALTDKNRSFINCSQLVNSEFHREADSSSKNYHATPSVLDKTVKVILKRNSSSTVDRTNKIIKLNESINKLSDVSQTPGIIVNTNSFTSLRAALSPKFDRMVTISEEPTDKWSDNKSTRTQNQTHPDLASRKLMNEKKKSKYITSNEKRLIASSPRSTDASSESELEQIFHHSNKNNSIYNDVQTKGKKTTCTHQNNNAFMTAVNDLSLIKKGPDNIFSDSTLIMVDNNDVSNADNVDSIRNTNYIDNNASSLNSSRQIVPTSESDSSALTSPYLDPSQNLNFTRIANTDANNNTLEHKTFLKDASPDVLPFTKPAKTYSRKSNVKPNHLWFETSNNKKKNSNNLSVARPIRKKKLFNLFSSYQDSFSSSSSYLKLSPPLNDISKRTFKPKVKIMSSNLYDITELDESSQDEKPGSSRVNNNNVRNKNNCKKTPRAKCIRRSSRNRKAINYKEISDTESEKTITQDLIFKNNKKNAMDDRMNTPRTNLQIRSEISSYGKSDNTVAKQTAYIKNIILNNSNNNMSGENKTIKEPTILGTSIKSSDSNKANQVAIDSKSIKLPSKALDQKHVYDFEELSDECRPGKKIDKTYLSKKIRNKSVEKTNEISDQMDVNDVIITAQTSLGRPKVCNPNDVKVKQIREDKDNGVSKSIVNLDAFSNLDSPNSSFKVQSIRVDALVHHENNYDPMKTLKGALKRTANVPSPTKVFVGCCDRPVVKSKNQLNGREINLVERNDNLLRLMNSLMVGVNNLKSNIHELFSTLNLEKQSEDLQ